jgi:hypothetical protein
MTVIDIQLVHGVTHLSYTIRDEGGLTDSSTITITSNRAPIVPDATGATNGFPTVQIPLLPTEPDGDHPLTVTCNTPADGDGPNTNFEVNINPDGEDSSFTHPRFVLDVSVQGPFTQGTADAQFHCTVMDEFGAYDVATVTITNS